MLKKITLLVIGIIAIISEAKAQVQEAHLIAPIVLPDYGFENLTNANITSSQSITLLPGFKTSNGVTISLSIANPPGTVGNPLIRSYLQQDIVKVAGVINDSQLDALGAADRQTTRVYLDGFGKVVQSVVAKGSPLQHDIIQTASYDELGRQLTSYLPYVGNDGSGDFRLSSIREQAAFYYNGTSDKIADDLSPFAQQLFENSPLQRTLQAGSVGAGYQPGQHSKSINYRSNLNGDAVINWDESGVNQGTYAANTLDVKEVTDEQGLKVIVFTDLSGHTILKRQLANETVNGVFEQYFDTYYVYNMSGMISYIIPPKATAAMASHSWGITQTDVDKLVFKFVYDNLGRLIEKTIPGNIVIYTVYDPVNRPVLIQDGNLRTANKWNYIKYDAKGRAISQGIYADATHITRAAMQTYVSSLDYSVNYYEDRSTNSATGYYTNNVFPTSSLTELAYSYYDNYDIDNNGTADYSYQAQSLTNEGTQTTYAIRGMVSAVKTRSIGQGISTPIWLTKVMFYNDKGALIQTLSNNQLNASLNDIKTNVVDFTGKPLQTKVVKVVPSNTTTVLSTLSYDHADRVTGVDQSYNGATAIHIAKYTYNELGQLVDKQLHSTNGTTFLQSLDYRYNIKGRLLSINNSTLANDGVKNDDANDVFGMEVLYDQVDNTLGNTAYYNGSLSAVRWMSKDYNGTSSNERSYKYDYDNLNRLKNATYADRAVSASWVNLGGYDEKNIKYDENSNILTLQRNSLITGTTTSIDDLTYTYNGNQLNAVADASGNNMGVKTASGSGRDYDYYAETGNLKEDYKKGLSLTYNEIGRTDQITVNSAGTGNYITYTYDAAGVLLRKQQAVSSSIVKTTDYVDGFVYENSVLVTFTIPEGRVHYSGGAYKPEYVITDNMGNARVSFDEQSGVATVRQENSYYPFGLAMNTNFTPGNPNTQLYNGGSEVIDDFGGLPDYFQTFYRNYDPALGRWISVDPESESAESMSNYQYALNNPLMYNDPLGNVSESDWNKVVNAILNGVTQSFRVSDDGYQPLNPWESFQLAANYNDRFDLWGSYGGMAGSYRQAAINFNNDTQHNGGFTVDPNNQSSIITLMTWMPEGTTSFALMVDLKGYDLTIQGKKDANQGGYNPNDPYSDPYTRPGTWSEIWNSNIMRMIIPDMINLNINLSAVWGPAGFGGSHEVHYLLRGPDAGLYSTYTKSTRVGGFIDLSAGLSASYDLRAVRNIHISDYYGDAIEAGGKFIGGASISVSHDGWVPSWLTGGISFGLSGGGYYGTSQTYPLMGKKFNK